MGNKSINGLVTLPTNLEKLGRNVFKESNLYALRVPGGVKTIPEQQFRGAAYVRIDGAGTSAETGAFANVCYVIAPAACPAKLQAETDGAIFIPVEEVIEQDGFYYRIVGGKAVLLCAIDNTAVPTEIRVPVMVKQGSPVTGLASGATHGLPAVTQIWLPLGITIDPDALSGSPNAVVNTYSDTDFCITNVRANVNAAQVGQEITFLARTNATSEVSYSFEVCRVESKKDSLISESVLYISDPENLYSNRFAVTPKDPGQYIATVTCRDVSGEERTASSAPVTVLDERLSIYEIAVSAADVREGADLKWQVGIKGGNGTIRYQYTLLRNGETVTAVADSAEAVYTHPSAAAGEYQLYVQASDDYTTTTTLRFESVSVYDEASARPIAPELTATSLSATEESALVMPAQNIALTWNAVANARLYGILVQVKRDGAWSTLSHIHVSGGTTDYSLPAQLFQDITESTLCRIGLYSVNIDAGDARYYYAAIQPVELDRTLLIDGASEIRWYEAYYGSVSRSFEISGDLPWTAKGEEGDDWYTFHQDENLLTVTLLQNDTGNDLRGTLTLTNGVNTATLNMRHYAYSQSPLLVAPLNASQAATPARMPLDTVTFEVETPGYDTDMEILDANGAIVWQSEVDSIIAFNARSAGLAEGAYRIRLRGYAVSPKYTCQRDKLLSDWYVYFHDTEASVTINGTSALTLTALRAVDATLSFSGGLPSAVSDADWLTAAIDKDGVTLHITAAENADGQARTGHITVSCGAASAKLTLVQPSGQPRLMTPATLSENEASPTSVYMQAGGWNSFSADCDSIVIEQLEYGEYVEIDSDNTGTYKAISIEEETAAVSVTHRLTITRGSLSKVYFFKLVSSSSYIAIDGDDVRNYSCPDIGGTVSLTLASSGSWTAVSNSDWLTVSIKSGSANSGGKTITLTAEQNATGEKRFGTVTFSRGSYQKATAIVSQFPIADSVSAVWDATASANLGASGAADSHDLSISTVGDWTATVSESWLGFDSACNAKSASGKGVSYQTVYCAELPAGNPSRTGTVTIASGSAVYTATVTQLPAIVPAILAPAYSSDKNVPSIHKQGDLVIRWTGDPNAAYYRIRAYLCNEAGTYPAYFTVIEDGKDEYSVTILQDWMKADTSTVFYFTLSAYDKAGNVHKQSQYFNVASGNGVFLDGKTKVTKTKLWDTGDEWTVTVTSDGDWTAVSDSDWIRLNKTNGAPGDTLTVTLTQNFGAKRSGNVTVSYLDGSATLTLHQYGYIPDLPSLKNVGFSSDMRSPAILPANTNHLTLAWDKEDQPYSYGVSLYEVHSTSRAQHFHTYEQDDTRIFYQKAIDADLGEYTIPDLSLRPGALYLLTFKRNIRDDRDENRCYYFIAEPEETPYVATEEKNTDAIEFDSGEDWCSFTVKSNCTWTATSDSDWLMVAEKAYDSGDLSENGDIPDDYRVYTSFGDRLRVSALANTSPKTRTGHVTLSVPGQSVILTITQPRYITAAALTYPALTDNRSDPVRLPYADVTLRWTESPDGTGKYTVTLRERLPGEIQYQKVFEKSASARTLTIPVDKLTQNADYILYLETWADDEYAVAKEYRFHVNFQNALSVTADVVWKDSLVTVSAHASGGSGSGYRYAFGLLKNGVLEDNSLWFDSDNSYSFSYSGAGTWQIQAYVGDSDDQVESFIVSEHVAGEVTSESYIALGTSAWMPAAAGETVTLSVLASGSWTCASNASWLIPSAESGSGSSVSITATENDGGFARVGKLTFRCGGSSAVFTVSQGANSSDIGDDSSVSLSETEWAITGEGAAARALTVHSSGDWILKEYPTWINPSAALGQNDDTITVIAAANPGAARAGTLTFVCGTATAECTVRQSGKGESLLIQSFAMTPDTVSTGETVTFTVNAPSASAVRLLVDGVGYEEYPLENGSGNFTRSFSTGGSRSVRLLPINGAAEGTASEAKTLTVTSLGKLAQPIIEDVKAVTLGQGASVRWKSVPHAEKWSVRLTNGNRLIWSAEYEASVTECDIPASKLTAEGAYTFLLMATAAGYGQSENGIFISVVPPKVDFYITAPVNSSTYVPTDEVDIRVSNPSLYNIAVKVTDANGYVTWLPEDNGTVCDANIQDSLKWSPTATGKVRVQVMAFPNAIRGSESSAWYRDDQSVSFVVNGPLAHMIYLGGNNTSASMLASELTTLSVKTNNGAVGVRVLLDGAPLTVYKSGASVAELTQWDSEIDYVRTFSCDLPEATSGLRRYTVEAFDNAGRTHRRTYTLYVADPLIGNEALYMYPSQRDVYFRTTPATADAKAVKLPLSAKVEVLGYYEDAALGSLFYVRYETRRGFIKVTDLRTTQVIDYSAIRLTPTAPADISAGYINDENPISFSWTSDMSIPSGAVYVLQKRLAGTTSWISIKQTSTANTSVSTNGFGAGAWQVSVALQLNNEYHGRAVFPYTVIVFGNATDYLNYMQSRDNNLESYSTLIHRVGLHCESMRNLHDMNTTGCYLNGAWVEPIDIEGMIDNAAFQFYYNVFGEGIAIPDKEGRQIAVVNGILETLAPQAEDLFIADCYDGITDFIERLDMGREAIDTITKVIMEAGKNGKRLSAIGDAMKSVPAGLLEKVAKGVKVADLVIDLTDAIILGVRYSMIDKDELDKIGNGFLRSSDPEMREIGSILLAMKDPGNVVCYALAIFSLDVAAFSKNVATDAISGFISKVNVYGAMYMVAIKGALCFNDLAFNTTETQNAAVALQWTIEGTSAYYPTFIQAWARFESDPLHHYAEFISVCDTYLRLLDSEYQALANFRECVGSSLSYKIGGIFSDSDEKMEASIAKARKCVSEVRQNINETMIDLYVNCLSKYDLPYLSLAP